MNPFKAMIHGGASPQEMADWLDGLTHPVRQRSIESLDPDDQRVLWSAVEGAWPMGLDHFVPEGHGPLEEVIHWGKNTLPAFKTFQKRFCRPTRGPDHGDVLWGYNENPANPALVLGVVGPGYFVARLGEEEDTPVWVDYHLTPPAKPDHWPPIKPSGNRFGFFVYHKTIDKMRKVSEHVSIGAAFKYGNVPLGAYFMLCRED